LFQAFAAMLGEGDAALRRVIEFLQAAPKPARPEGR